MGFLSIVARSRLRAFSRLTLVAILCTQLPAASPATAHDDADCLSGGNADCGQHNMMLVGNRAAFVSHLPMFDNEHRFQVIARARFTDGRNDLGAVYEADRADHPEVRMYTVRPDDQFALSRLFAPAEEPARPSFRGTVFRDHLERGGVEIEGLRGISVDVEEIVYASELTGADGVGPELRYVLFGSGDELYLAHQIAAEPDFDQIVAVSFGADGAAPEVLRNGAVVAFPGRENGAAGRIRTGERVLGEMRGPAMEIVPVTVTVGIEHYFEEGELRMPPTFQPTELELEAGF